MIVPDLNLLLYAHFETFPQHETARRWWESCLNGVVDVSFRLLRELGAAGSLTTDVQIAATALEWNAEVWTNDTDFQRFSGVRVRNPLVSRTR